MNKLKNKVIVARDTLAGELLKLNLCLTKWSDLSSGINSTEQRKEKVIVSLTSYGRRVDSVLPYTILSLMRQTFKPDAIVLWLDDEHWNNDNIPQRIKLLTEKGLQVRFCSDLKSYKKHIPALNAFPDDIIITVDDDLFYAKDTIERLIQSYKNNPFCLYALRGHRPTFGKTGELLPYKQWDKMVYGAKISPVFPITCGFLMKRSLLYKDVTNVNLCMKLAPKADDVWIYFMSILVHTPTQILSKKPFGVVPLDNIYQFTHKDAGLWKLNYKKSYNDVQIDQVMKYYGIKPSDLLLQ